MNRIALGMTVVLLNLTSFCNIRHCKVNYEINLLKGGSHNRKYNFDNTSRKPCLNQETVCIIMSTNLKIKRQDVSNQ